MTLPRRPLPTLPDDALAEDITDEITEIQNLPISSPWLERADTLSTPPAPELRDDPESIAANLAAWVARLVGTLDAVAFARGVQKLEPALRLLVDRGDMEGLWNVSRAMHEVASDGSTALGSRGWSAVNVLRLLDDPATLVRIGEHLLVGREGSREFARRLLGSAGVAGAYGLYGARVKVARLSEPRPLFVTVIKDFGPRAWPVVRAALEKIAALAEPNPGTIELAEDLLLCVPDIGGESAGHVVLRFLRWRYPNVCRAATAAIVKLWGERAKPVLVGMLQAKDDGVRAAGLAGLRQIGGIDEHGVPRLHGILTGRVAASEELRAAAAAALATPTAVDPTRS
jgi:serine/threonine-protein kinase